MTTYSTVPSLTSMSLVMAVTGVTEDAQVEVPHKRKPSYTKSETTMAQAIERYRTMITVQALMLKNITDLNAIALDQNDDNRVFNKGEKCYGQGYRVGAFTCGMGAGGDYPDYFLEYNLGRGIGETSTLKPIQLDPEIAEICYSY